jgi:coenzyme PQQ precursor peptide PqqA
MINIIITLYHGIAPPTAKGGGQQTPGAPVWVGQDAAGGSLAAVRPAASKAPWRARYRPHPDRFRAGSGLLRSHHRLARFRGDKDRIRRPPGEEMTMAWTTPTLVEICVGLEINGYLPAEF